VNFKDKVKKIEKRIKQSFSVIKEELEEHLSSINENTNEIQYNSEHIYELNKKMDKLMQRMDEIELMMLNNFQQEDNQQSQKYNVSTFGELNQIEKEIFLILYQKRNLTFESISNRLALSKEQVKKNIANLIVKGIPIIKRYSKNSIFVEIDGNFMLTQLKRNIMEIDRELLAQ